MIKVQNIYYMLAYAFQNLNSQDEKEYSSEEFKFVDDLFAAILANGIAKRLKQGLRKEYVVSTEELYSPKGKICLSETITRQSESSRLTVCQVDDYIENTYMNQILKSTAMLLLRSKDVKDENKRKLKRSILYFAGVDQISCKNIQWSTLRYNRSNKSYKMLMNICYLVIEGMLISETDGKYKLNEFIDDQRMSSLYEKFILAYYRRHYPSVKATQSHIEWNTDDAMVTLLPRMKSDVMLEYKGFTFIIDAKYYASSLQTGQYGTHSIHSNNLYQIFAYVKNKDKNNDGSVAGMLLYANTDGENPDVDYRLSGNKISVKTLDLNCPFQKIQAQLEEVISTWLSENRLDCERCG